MSELIRSVSFQSGPLSSTTTFLPALARTAAYTEPEAPEPTTTTSTFSFADFSLAMVASSPLLRRGNVRHVGNAERGIALHGAVDHVDRIAAQHAKDERRRRPLP